MSLSDVTAAQSEHRDRQAVVARRRDPRAPGGARAPPGACPASHLDVDRRGARVRDPARPSGSRRGGAGGHAAAGGGSSGARRARAQVLGKVGAPARRIRAARFDVAIDLQGLIKSGLLTAYTGAPLRIGFTAGHCRERPERALHQPAGARRPPTARARGRPVPVPARRRSASRRGRSSSTCPMPARGRAPHGGASWASRASSAATGWWRSIPARAARTSGGRSRTSGASRERLASEPDARVLLLWGPDEVAHGARRSATGCRARARSSRRPRTSHELAALLRRAALMVANDTGPLHLAAALGTPCLGLFGPTRAERNGPYGPRGRGLQSPDGTMAALDAGGGVRRGAGDARRAGGRGVSRLSRHHHRVERGGAPARLPRERGLGGRDRRGGRRVRRQDGPDRARVHRQGLGAAVARLRGPEELRHRPGDRRLDPLARRRRAGDLRAARAYPRHPRATTAPRTATRSRGGTSSGAPGCATAASIPTTSSGSSGGAPGASWRTRSTSRSRVDGRVETLAEPMLHHSYRDLEDFVRRSNRYSTLAAQDWIRRGRRVGLAGARDSAPRPLLLHVHCSPRLPRRLAGLRARRPLRRLRVPAHGQGVGDPPGPEARRG